MYGRVVTAFAVAGLLSGSAVASAQATEPVASTAEMPVMKVRAEPADSPGENPFTRSVAGAVLDVAVARSSGAVSGGEPGLYGGTRENACDRAAMIRFLQEDPERGAAFAAVEGIAPTAIADYVTALTPVTLRTDTAVTNHGFADGHVTPFQAVLQAGTAVMVDQFGAPQVRCYCGNPLASAAQPTGEVDYEGPAWSGLSSGQVNVISPASAPVQGFVITTPTNEKFVRPSGTGGEKDSDAPGDNTGDNTAGGNGRGDEAGNGSDNGGSDSGGGDDNGTGGGSGDGTSGDNDGTGGDGGGDGGGGGDDGGDGDGGDGGGGD